MANYHMKFIFNFKAFVLNITFLCFVSLNTATRNSCTFIQTLFVLIQNQFKHISS